MGEKTSIEFAMQTNGPVLLILDDALARKKASAFCITIVGTVMLIYKAEQKQYLNNADDLVKGLIARGYRVDDDVIRAEKQQLKK
jgi:predicted nucleic acid-binding protein